MGGVRFAVSSVFVRICAGAKNDGYSACGVTVIFYCAPHFYLSINTTIATITAMKINAGTKKKVDANAPISKKYRTVETKPIVDK